MADKSNFLIVDDDEIFLFTATHVIKKIFPDVEIITCRNGEEAVSKLDGLSPKAMFIDLNMPIMDGWELMDHISERYKEVPCPIAIVTSSIDPSDKNKATEYWFKPAFLEKPLSVEAIQGMNISI